jgi:hypothetical protein
MKKIFYFIAISMLSATELGNETYLWPTDASKTITTVFGDVRPRRYHAGLDIRTYGRSGDNLYAIADGYVERIRVSSSGYGKALYLRLNDGRIVVYAHMSQFSPTLNTLAQQIQKKEQKYSINQILDPQKYKVKKGDIIGFTGDTGSISGPHLHFEIRDKSNRPLNPLLTNFEIKDTRFPEANEIAIIPLEENSRINNQIQPITFDLIKINKQNYKLESPIYISGQFGIAVKIIDRIDAQPFRFGLYGIELYIDGNKYYSIKYENFDFDEGELVYTERDYALIQSGKGKFYRLFTDQSRKELSFHDKKNKNINNLDDGKHEFKILAFDFNQNTITIKGELIIDNKISNTILAKSTAHKTSVNKKCINCEIHQYEHGTFLSVPKIEIPVLPEISFISAIGHKNEISLHTFENNENYNFVFNSTDLNSINSIKIESNDFKLDYDLHGISTIPGKPFELSQSEITINGSGDTFYDSSFVWIKKLDTIPNLKKGKIIEGPWEVGPDFIPYRNQIEITINSSQIDASSIKHHSIYYLNKKNDAWYFMPTTYSKEHNSFNTSALSGEVFALIKEENPPVISGLSPQFGKTLNSRDLNYLSFNIKDDLAGIDGENDVLIKINNHKVIHEYNSYRKEVKYFLNEKLIQGNNNINIILKDRAGNIKELNGQLIFNSNK